MVRTVPAEGRIKRKKVPRLSAYSFFLKTTKRVSNCTKCNLYQNNCSTKKQLLQHQIKDVGTATFILLISTNNNQLPRDCHFVTKNVSTSPCGCGATVDTDFAVTNIHILMISGSDDNFVTINCHTGVKFITSHIITGSQRGFFHPIGFSVSLYLSHASPTFGSSCV